MAIIEKKDQRAEKPHIDLSGPQGNAFCLLGTARSLSKSLGKSLEDTDRIVKEMQSIDYENLIRVFDREFGDFVDLYR
jgi:hypothetical protein